MTITAATGHPIHTDGIRHRTVYRFATTSATAADTTIELGFQPTSIMLLNITDIMQHEFFAGMAADTGILHTGSTGAITVLSSNGFTLTDTGVTIAAEILIASKEFVMVAAA